MITFRWMPEGVFISICVDKSMKEEQICEALQKIKAARGLPKRIRFDNKYEFISWVLDAGGKIEHWRKDYNEFCRTAH